MFYFLGVGFLMYSVKVISSGYDKKYREREAKRIEFEAKGLKPPRGGSMAFEIGKFIGYDWIFLIYMFVFCISSVYDIVCIVVGALDKTACFGMIGNIVSGCLHMVLRCLMCCFFCFIACQVNFAENPICKPFLSCLTCGLID
jgi:hypothetical protein